MLRRAFVLAVAAGLLPTPLSAAASDWPTPSGANGTGFVADAPAAKVHSLRWSTKISDLPSAVYPMSPLLAYRGKVFVNGAATNSVIALDAATGEVVWRFSPDPRATGAFGGYPNPNEPFIADGIYYTSANNGFLYALDPQSGKKIWSYRVTGTDYNKAIAKVEVCQGRVFVDTLGGIGSQGQDNLFAVDAKTGKKLWGTYAGAPDWPGDGVYPDFPSNPTAADLAKLGRSTRRFEARPGVACFRNRVYYFAEDGILRVLDAANGIRVGAYDVLHHGMDLGFAVDGATGIVDPVTGDLVKNSLNNRMVRLLDEKLETVCGGQVCDDPEEEQEKVHEGWRHPYGDCAESEFVCGIATASRGDVVETHSPPLCGTGTPPTSNCRADGILGGAVFSGGVALADWGGGKRVVYSASHDGFLYAMDFDDPIGDDGEPSEFKVPFDPIPAGLRSHYTRNDGCAVASRCRNGPWEQRASNVSGPAVAGEVVYIAASMAHKMYGFNWMTGAKVFEYEVKWDKTSQYPPFGDTKPAPFVDLDELVQTTPAHDGRNVYFAANNGVVYAFSTQESIARPRRNLAILGSGVVPFIPKWTEALGAFDYVWTPQGDWYNPGYTSKNSLTAQQAPPGFADATTPFGYKGVQQQRIGRLALLLLLAAAAVVLARRAQALAPASAPLSLDLPPLLGRAETLVESLEESEDLRRRHDL